MRREKSHVYYSGKPDCFFTCTSALHAGIHKLDDVPTKFTNLGEILVLADYYPEGEPLHFYSKMRKSIFAFDFRISQVEVIPQDWYNKGNYDFAYEWIARVARDPQTHFIFGEGVRLGIFQLDETGQNIKQWLNSLRPARQISQ
jgi:hypothetical protein